MKKLKNSGFDETYRREILKSARDAFKNMLDLDKTGENPLNRKRSWKRKERTWEKKNKKTTWFKNGGYTNYIMIPAATPHSHLKKEIEKAIAPIKKHFNPKIIERQILWRNIQECFYQIRKPPKRS